MNWLLENTVVAAGGACVVFAICRTLNPRPALAHVLWLLVLVKLLCPPILRWSLPFDPPSVFAETAPTTKPAEDTRSIERVIRSRLRLAPVGDAPMGEIPVGVSAAKGRQPRTSSAIPLEAPPPRHASRAPAAAAPTTLVQPSDDWTWTEALALVWLLGSGGVLFSMMLGVARVRRMRREGTRAPEWLRREVEALAQMFGMRPPDVAVSCIGSAFVVGLGRPTLIWPAAHAPDHGGRITEAIRRQYRSVLAHELAHIRRRDHWIAWLEVVSTIALWWHPLVWVVRSRLRLQAELACDAWAIWAVPDSRHAYAGALIDAVERESQAVATVPVLAARPGARRAFEKRLMMILNENVPRRLTRWALLPVAALSLTVLTGFSFAQERRGRTQANEKAAAQAEILRAVNKQLKKDLGAKYQVKRVEDIDKAVQRFLDDQLAKINAEGESKSKPAKSKPRKSKPQKSKPKKIVDRRVTRNRGDDTSEIGRAMKQGLEEALREIRDDEDLRRLGLTDDVQKLVKSILSGEGGQADFAEGLQGVISKAMQEGLKEAKIEIRNDKDLKELGIADDVEDLVESILGSLSGEGGDGKDFGEALQNILGEAMKEGLKEAKKEIRNDKDLKELGIAGDVENLVESLLGSLSGEGGQGDFATSLEAIIKKAMGHAAEEGATEESKALEKVRRELIKKERRAEERRKRERRRQPVRIL